LVLRCGDENLSFAFIMAQSRTDMAAKLKEQGTEAFKKKDYDQAVKMYSDAIAISKCDHVLYSNRSAAFAEGKKYKEALHDAQKCVELKPGFAKGYGRVALAQYNLNKLMDAKKSYQEGLKHDSQNQVLKTGLRDTEKSFRKWFLSVLAEATEAQIVTQQRLCEATHQLVTDGHTSLSFLEAHQRVLQLNLPGDVLEKNGISEEDLHQTIADYDRAYDYEVITAVQNMFLPCGKGDPERSGKIEIATVLDAHKFMEMQMKNVVEEFNQLPAETKHSIPKKLRENAAELLVSVAVETSFKIRGEDLELAVTMHGEQFQSDPAMMECQTQLGSLMQLLLESPFVEKVVDEASKLETGVAGVSTLMNASESRIGARACYVGAISALGLVVLLGMMRWRARNK